VLRIHALFVADQRIGHVHVQRFLTAHLARAQDVQAHARHDGRQPCFEVVDLDRVRTAETQPGLLDGILRFGERAEHAIGHRLQVSAVLLKALREPYTFLGHSVTFLHRRVSVAVTRTTHSL
jgi:hypothetical protein